MIRCQLLGNKTIVGCILIQRPDNVISISVSVWTNSILAVKQYQVFGIGISGNVQPVPAPSFAVAGRTEQPIDDLRKRIRRFVFGEFLYVSVIWRQADQIVIDTAEQNASIGSRCRCQRMLLEIR